MPTMMKAVVYDGFGGPEVLQMREVEVPLAEGDRVQVAVQAAGVNPFDIKLRRGDFASAFEFRFPVCAGMDFAGVVTACGPDAAGFEVGDRVCACVIDVPISRGAYAEVAVAPAPLLAKVPPAISLRQAAALPMAGLTAWQALEGLRAGQRVLVHAGAGGVGGYAIQLAKRAGAFVYTTASARNHEYVRALGADHPIDYTHEDLRTAIGRPLDRVVDTVGGDVLAGAYDLLAEGGVLVPLVQPPDPARSPASMLALRPDGVRLRQLLALAAAGELRWPTIDTRPLREAGRAHAHSEAGHVQGKLVLEV